MARYYMDATALLATFVKDHPGGHLANDFWMNLLGTGGSVSVSITSMDRVMAFLEQDVMERRAPYRFGEAFFSSRIDRIDPDVVLRKRALQLLGERAWPYRFCLDVAIAERLNPDGIVSFDTLWEGTVWSRVQEVRWPLRERPFQRLDPHAEEEEPEGSDYVPEAPPLL